MSTPLRLATYIRDISQGSPHSDVSKLNLYQTLRHQFGYSDAEIELVSAQIACLLLINSKGLELSLELAHDLVSRELTFSGFRAKLADYFLKHIKR